MNIIRSCHNIFFPEYPKILEKQFSGCSTVLDVGCGKDSPIKSFSKNFYCVGVDAHAPAIKQSKQSNIHNEYYNMDIIRISDKFQPESFDCVLASDVIEHLRKEDGQKLLDMMENIARKKVIIYTPRGFLPQEVCEGNPYQLHLSGWDVEEMRSRYYNIIGYNGLGNIWKIKWLWQKLENAPIHIRVIRKILIDLTQFYTRTHPEYAHQILCVLDKSNPQYFTKR